MKFARHIYFAIFLALVIALGFLSLRTTLLIPGTLGHNWDWSFPPLATQLATALPKMFSSWNVASLGAPAVLSLPVNLLMSVFFSLGLAGISGEIVSKLILPGVLVLGSVTMYFLLSKLFLAKAKNYWFEISPVYLGAIFFGFSPFIFGEFIGGAVTQFVSYALIPLALLFFLSAQEAPKRRWLWVFGTAVVLSLLTISTHNLIITAVLLIVLIIIAERRRNYLINLVALGGFYLVLNLYWILPFASELLYAQTFFNAESFLSLGNLTNDAQNIGRAWFQIGYAREFFENLLPPALLPWWILLIGIFGAGIIGAAIKSKSKPAIFWLAIFLSALVFVTAGLPPWGGLVVWLFKHVAVIRGFRSIQHFIPVSVLAFSLVLAYGINYLLTRLQYFKRIWRIIGVSALVLLVLVWIGPFVWSGDIGSAKLKAAGMSRVDNFQLSPGYMRAIESLAQEKEVVRFLPFPTAFSPVYLETEYQDFAQGGDPTLSTMALPEVVADFAPPGYPRQIMQVFEKNICSEDISATDNDQILSLLNIKYVLQRRDLEPNPGSPCAKRWFPELADEYLQSDESLTVISEEDYVSLYERANYYPRIYAANHNIAVDGDIATLNDIIRQGDLTPINNIFFRDLPPTAQPDQISAAYTRQSFEAEDPQYLVSPGIWTGNKYSESKDIIYPSKESGFNTLKYKIPVDQSGRYEFYVKIRQDTNEGLLQTAVDGHEIGQPLDAYYQSPTMAEGKRSYYYKAVRVGEIDLGAGEHEIEFTSLPVPAKPLKEYKQSLDQFYLVKKEAGSASPSVDSLPRVDFQEISPTRYHVEVSGASAPYYLNFLETYNSNWQLRIAGRAVPNDKHFVVNGYANSWVIEDAGDWEGEIVYHTQELYYLGLWLSGGGGAISLLFIILAPYLVKKFKPSYDSRSY